jgi:hypothetical protein
MRQGDAAAYLCFSRRTLIRETNARAVACHRLGRRLVVYRKRDLDAFMERNRRAAIGEGH